MPCRASSTSVHEFVHTSGRGARGLQGSIVLPQTRLQVGFLFFVFLFLPGKCWFISSLLCNILRRQHLYHKSWVFSAADGAMSCTAISSDLPTSCSVESLPFAAKSKGAMPPVCRLPPPSPRSSRGLSLCPSRCFPGNFEGGPHARRRCTHVLLTLPAPPRPPPPPRPHPAASTELAEGEGQRGSVSNSVAGTRELVRGRGCRVCFAVASSHSSDLADRSRGGFGAHGACRGGVKCIWQGAGGKLLKFSACVWGGFLFQPVFNSRGF